MAKRGPRRTALQKEEDYAAIARLDRMGYSQREIAARVGLTQGQVCQDIKQIKKRYQTAALGERSAQLVEKLLQYRDVRAEAFEAWEDSKKPGIKVVEEQVLTRTKERDPDGDPALQPDDEPEMLLTKIVTTREESLPRNEYLGTILKTIEGERELLGLDAPKKVDLKSQVFSWDMLAEALPPSGGPVPDRIEEELARIAALPDAPPVNGLRELPPGDGAGGNGSAGNGHHDPLHNQPPADDRPDEHRDPGEETDHEYDG